MRSLREGSQLRSDRGAVERSTGLSVGLGLRWPFFEAALRDELPPQLGFFEFSPENYMGRGGHLRHALERLAQRRPLRSHGLTLNLGGCAPLDPRYLSELRDLLDAFGLAEHSDHLCWTAHDGSCLHELMPLSWTRATRQRCVDRVHQVSEALGRPLSLENISAYVSVGDESSAANMAAREAEFWWQLTERSGCGLLLDVNNVWVNARNHGFDAWGFIASLPLHCVTQLHVAGGSQPPGFDGQWIDTHSTDVPDAVLDLMGKALRRTGPVPILYERDHDVPPFADLLTQVQRIDAAARAALTASANVDDASPTRRARVELPAGAPHRDATHMSEAVRATLDPTPAKPVAAWPNSTAATYRRLVRATIADAVRRLMPRSAARLGERFDALLEAFMAAGAAESPRIRDLGPAFVDFARDQVGALAPASHLLDLMRHEMLTHTVANHPPAPELGSGLGAGSEAVEGGEVEPALDRGLRFDPTARLVAYHHAVHLLPLDLDDHSVPEAIDTRLLVYRDDADAVRCLELSRLAWRLCEALMRGDSLEASARAADDRPQGPLPAALVSRLQQLLVELGERGVLTGVR